AARAAVLFGPVGTGLVVALWMFFVIGLVLRFGFGVHIDAGEALRALAVLAVGTPAIYGLGMLFSVAVLVIRENWGLVQMVRGLFTVLCGMSFPIAVLPGWARDIALSLPPTYIIADVRQVLLAGSTLMDVRVTLLILAGAGIVLCLAAALAFRGAEHRARARSGFAQY
ncbi:MAG: ABC transporter permease, partial [Candidatus Dormibacteraeota bacterium]|nr:ABC transporter permease [Candidatus Dormibacteraeota bacterium]